VAVRSGFPGCGYLDGVSAFLQLGYQALGPLFLIVARRVVILAEVGEHPASGEHVPDDLEKAVGDGDGCLVRAAPVGDLPVLDTEVAAPGVRRCPGRLDLGIPLPRVARRLLRGGVSQPIRGCRGTDPPPRLGAPGWEPAHVGAGFGDDQLGIGVVDPRDVAQQPGGRLITRCDAGADLGIKLGDGGFQEVQVGQNSGGGTA
jgi:hypothetical protein